MSEDAVPVSPVIESRLLARFLAKVEAHEAHSPRLRLDWDGVHRCPACEPRAPRPVRVRQVMPGCWEVWCHRCPDAPVVAQVGTWERAMDRAGQHLAEAHRTLTSGDPEPPVGTLVRDACGMTWLNDGHRPACWVQPDADEHDPETWTKTAGNYGPVTVLEWGSDD